MPDERPSVTEVADLPALRALADSLRMKVLELLADEPRTVKALAAVLDVPRNKLHYHVNVLAKHGLIRVVASTRTVGGALERSYERTGRMIRVANVAPMAGRAAATIAGLLSDAADAVDERLRTENDSRLAVGSLRLRLTTERHEEFVRRLHALVEEFDAADDESVPSNFVFAVYS
jgi:DNA-binding transcriptional ArsR family regulator